MKTFKLFNFNLRSSAMVQADGCTTARQKIGVTPRTTSTIARFASVLCLILIMLFTLGVGEIWAGTKRVYCEYSGVSSWWSTIYVYAWGGGKDPKKYTMVSTGTSNLVRCDIDDYHTDLLFYKSTSQGGSWETQSVDVSIGSNNRWSLGDGGYGNKGTISNQQRYAPGTAIDGLVDRKNPHNQMFSDGTYSVELEAHKTYEFKILETSTLYGLNDCFAMSNLSATTLNTSGYQIRLCTAGAGTYTFSYSTSNHKLSITFPTVTHPSIDYCYLIKYGGWGAYKYYIWNCSSTKVAEWNGDSNISGNIWPGTVVSAQSSISGSNYLYIAPGEFANVQFNDGSNGNKSADYNTSDGWGKYAYHNGSAWVWGTWNFAVTLQNQVTTTSAPSNPSVQFNGDAPSDLTAPACSFYTFGGYYTAAGGGGSQVITAAGKWNASVSGYTDGSKKWIHEGGAATLYGKWTQSITLNQNGATTNGSTSLAATYNAVLDASGITNPSKTGYTFEGWTTGSGGTGDVVINASKVVQASVTDWTDSDKKWKHAGASTLYAKWTANNYTVTLNNQSATSAGTESVSVTYDANTNLTGRITCPTKTGYMFAGYYTGTGGSGVKLIAANGEWIASVSGYTDGSKNWKYVGDVTLNAYWIANPSAPTAPTYQECQVIPIYSQYYRTLSPALAGWSPSTKTDRTIGGVNMWEVSVGPGGNNYFGIDWGLPFDVSGYTGLHLDIYTPTAQNLNIYTINRTADYGNNTEDYLQVTTNAGSWTNVNLSIASYKAKGLDMLRNYIIKIVGNASDPMLLTNVYYYKTSDCPAAPTPVVHSKGIGTTQGLNVPMFMNNNGNLAGSITNDTVNFFVATLGNEILYKAVMTHDHVMWSDANPVLYVLNNSNERIANFTGTRNGANTVGTYEGTIPGAVDAEAFNWNLLVPFVGGSHQWNGHTLTDKMNYKRGYINIPNSDATVPTVTSAALKSESVNDGDTTVVVTGASDDSGQFFYYYEDEMMGIYHISLSNEYTIPTTTDGRVFNIKCYAVDFNGNMSEPKTVTISMPFSSTTNLALNRPITVGAGSYATRANDGSLTSRMEGANSDYVNQWLYIDLLGYYNLSEVKIWFENASSDNFVLQAAHTLPATIDDDTQWRTIYTNTSTPNTGKDVGDVNTYNVSGSTARYIRLKSYHNTTGYGVSIWEFEVYGSAATSKDMTAPTVSSAETSAIVNDDELQLTLTASDGSKVFRITDSNDNVYVKTADASNHVVMDNIDYTYCTTYTFSVQAMDAAANLSSAVECSGAIEPAADFDLIHVPEGGVTATVSGQAGDPWQAAYAIDGNDNTFWAGRNSGGGTTGEQWININLGRVFGVSSVKVAWNDNHASNLYIEGSRDGSNYYILKHITTAPTNYSAANNAIVYETYSLESHIRVRHLRLRAVDLTGEMAIRDVQIFGSCNDDYNKPIITQADIYRIECSSSDAAIRISVSAFDETTTAGSITYKAVFTTGGLSDQTGLTPTDGIITVSGLTEGNTYALRIYAYDGTNYSENYKDIASFTPRVSLYYFTGDATGTTGVWQDALSPEENAAKRRFSATAHSGIYHFSISVLGNDQQYRLYNDVEGHLTYVNDNNHWSVAGNQIISGHNGETIDVYAKDKDHFVSNFDEVYVYGAAIIDATTEGSAVRMSYADNKFAWEGFVASGTKAFRIIVKENGSSFTDHSRARIMPAADNFVNSSGWKYAKLTFDMETWEYEWSATDVSTYIYDDNSGDGKWSTTSNWLSGALPTIEKDVIITKPVTVDITTARANSVVLDQSGDNTGQLVLDAGKELVVAETVRKTTDGSNRLATGENDLVFNSTSGAGLGALAIGSHATANGLNNATVNFSTLSNGSTANETAASASNAQYVGTPFSNRPAMLYQFYNSWMYKFINTGVPGWTRVDGEDGLDAFQGYCIFSADGTNHVYWMQGTLVASEDQSINLQYNSGTASNPNNENMLANSWMAPIKIAAFQASDFTNADATIYIYNTGSPDDYKNNSGASTTGTSAGQYTTYTPGTAGTAIIPSMQAFSVYTHGSTPSISLDYSKIVYDPAVAGSVVPGGNRAPQRTETDEPEKMRLYIGAESGYGDMLYMLEREDFAEGFENGWDGRKMFGEDVAPQLYAFTPDGNMAINCIPTFEGQLLGFRKGAQDNTYTFTFEYDGDNMWYLNDLKEQTSTLISAFDSYTFTSEADDTEARFIISRSPIHSTPTAVESATGAQQPAIRKIVINDHVFIIRNGLMYDVTGIMVQ